MTKNITFKGIAKLLFLPFSLFLGPKKILCITGLLLSLVNLQLVICNEITYLPCLERKVTLGIGYQGKLI